MSTPISDSNKQLTTPNDSVQIGLTEPTHIEEKLPFIRHKNALSLGAGSKGILLTFLIFGLFTATEGSARTIYHGATLINPEGPSLPHSRIIVNHGRITCVSNISGCAKMDGDIEVDLSDRWITPGLIDTHVHLNFKKDALSHQRRRLAYGITTVRDAATLQLDKLLAHREQAVADAPLPSIVISALIHPFNADQWGHNDPESIALNLRNLDVDFIKLKNDGPTERLIEIIRAGKNAGLPVYGHTWYGPPPRSILENAINSGLDGVAHLMGIAPGYQTAEMQTMPDVVKGSTGFWEWRKKLWLTTDSDGLDRLIDLMVRNDVWLEPTLTFEYYWDSGVRPRYCQFLDTERKLSLRESLTWGWPSSTAPTFPKPYAMMAAFVKRFADKGGMIVAGTDNKCPGPDIHEEIRLLHKAGLTPRQALRAATSNAANVLGIAHDRGTIAIGQRADFIVFEQNPLVDLNAKIETVVLRGYEHNPQSLLKPESEIFKSKRHQAWINGFAKWSRYPFVALLLLGITLRYREERKRRLPNQFRIENKRNQPFKRLFTK